MEATLRFMGRIGGSLNDKDLRTAMRSLLTEAEERSIRHGAEVAAATCWPAPLNLTERLAIQQRLQARVVVRGWLVLASIDALPDDQGVWHFSASLHPRGRGSTEEDWANLGQIVALSGAPPEAMKQVDDQVQMGSHPNRPHHWLWPRAGTEMERVFVETSLAQLRQIAAPPS